MSWLVKGWVPLSLCSEIPMVIALHRILADHTEHNHDTAGPAAGDMCEATAASA